MTRSVLPIGILVFFALAMVMVPSSFGGWPPGSGLDVVGKYVTISQVDCEAVPNVTHEFFRDGRAHYKIPGSCLVRKTDGRNSIVKYQVDGNWTPGPKGFATETGRIYALGNIAPDLFQPGDPNDENNYTTFVVRLSCMGDPWLNDVPCSLYSPDSFAAAPELLKIFPGIKGGPFPLTKGAIPAGQQPLLRAEYGRVTAPFVGPVVSPILPKSVPGFAATQQPPPLQSSPAYGATYAPGTLTSLTRGHTTTVQVKVTNKGTLTWTPSGPNPFNLSYHWYRANSVPQGTAPAGFVVWDGPRFLVPKTVGTNQPVTIAARVTAPTTAGTYVLKWDMAHEGVAWFSGKGVLTFDQTVVMK